MDEYFYKICYIGENPLNYLIRCEQLEIIRDLFFKLTKNEQCILNTFLLDNDNDGFLYKDFSTFENILKKLQEDFIYIYR